MKRIYSKLTVHLTSTARAPNRTNSQPKLQLTKKRECVCHDRLIRFVVKKEILKLSFCIYKSTRSFKESQELAVLPACLRTWAFEIINLRNSPQKYIA